MHQRLLVPELIAGAPRPLVEGISIGVLDDKVCRSAQPLEHPLEGDARLRAVGHVEDLELEA